MPEATLVPPVPTINQSDSPEEIARVTENMQKIFDKVSPKIRGTATPESPPEPKQPTETPTAPVAEPTKPAQEPAAPQVEAPQQPADDHKVPSFIEKALSTEPVKPETTVEDDLPDELPDSMPAEERKSKLKAWREKWKVVKDENKRLSERPQTDVTSQERLTFLETQNKEMATQLSRMGVEHHQEFQQKILAPMQQSWNEASRIVHEAGGDPKELAKALALNGKAQYEALDTIFEGMPESAKIEANEAIRSYKRLDESRRKALADAPKTAEALKKADMQRQYAYLNQQKEEMKNLFDNAITKLRDEAKVEVLQKSNDPDAKWWNEQADQIVDTSRKLFLENTDMSKVAFALALAPMADVYRKLWMSERAARSKSDKIIKDRFGSEPNLSDSGGNHLPSSSVQEDLKKPFKDVFLREFHREREKGVR